jgi:uncharacterized membrane protein YwaF
MALGTLFLKELVFFFTNQYLIFISALINAIVEGKRAVETKTGQNVSVAVVLILGTFFL